MDFANSSSTAPCFNPSYADTFLQKYCGSEVLNLTRLLNQRWPEFPVCLQKLLFSWLPAAFALIGFVIFVFSYRFKRLDRQPFSYNSIILCRLIGCITIICLSLIELTIAISMKRSCIHAVDLGTPVGVIITMATMIAVELICKKKAIRSSGIVFITWLLLFASGLLRIKYCIEELGKHSNMGESAIFLSEYIIVIAEFLLSCFANNLDETDENACPKKKASFLNNILYIWFWKMAITGWKRTIRRDDLWTLDKSKTSYALTQQWDFHWNRSKKTKMRKRHGYEYVDGVAYDAKQYSKSKGAECKDGICEYNVIIPYQDVKPSDKANPKYPSIVWTALLCYKWLLLSSTFSNFVQVVLQFIPPLLLKFMLLYLQDSMKPLWYGIAICCATFFVSVLQSLLQQQSMYSMFMLGFNLKTVLMATIYNKALRLSDAAMKKSTVGEIVNHMTVDVQRLIDVSAWLQMIWSSPLQAALALYFLYHLLGWSAFVGFALALFLVPLNFKLSRIQKSYQIRQMKLKDDRIKLMNEIINGIKVVKLYAWEPPFEAKVAALRERELLLLRKSALVTACSIFTMFCSPFLIAVASFAAFTLFSTENVLTPEVAFVSLSLFNILRVPLNFFPAIISMLVQASVSNARLRCFLSLHEFDENAVERTTVTSTNAIEIKCANFTWDQNAQTFQLKDIDLTLKSGQLVAVIGQVGEGKSSLISAILGEMEKVSGSVKLNGSVAFVPQQAWIRNCTLRQNIIFTRKFEQRAYDKVVESCALIDDISMLPAGDETEVGEKGINLSGGQKQRISLARAIYQNRDIYLLDDPLSAVDAHVGKHIFDNVLSNKNGMLKNKTRILVTHSLIYLKETDYIVIMKGGRIAESGTFDELFSNNRLMSQYISDYFSDQKDPEAKDEVENLLKDPVFANIAAKSNRSTSGSYARQFSTDEVASESGVSRKQRLSQTSDDEQSHDKTKLGGTERIAILQDDPVAVGKVLWSVYKYYGSAIGYLTCFAVLLSYALSTVFGIASNLWLADWSTASDNHSAMASPSTNLDIRLSVYFILGISQGGFLFLATVLTCYGAVRASKILHSSAVHALMRSPMSFFDVSPIGVILNRVGKDIDIIDNTIPDSLRQSTLAFMAVISSSIIILISTPIAAVTMLPLVIFYYFIQKFYISTARQLKRLESASRSPIYSFFGETISGISSIRAYQVSDWFVDECFNRIDYNQIVFYPSLVATRWLAIYLQSIGNLIVLSAMLFAVFYRNRDATMVGLVGLSITYAMTMTMSLMMAVRTASDLETNIIAVERVKEYIELSSEKPWTTNIRPPPKWPKDGNIKLVDYSLRYRENSPLVLQNITLNIEPLEKIGIVGRTGAGKTSLSAALFRLVEPVPGGCIYVDDVDILSLGLHDLRSKLAIIPQEPVLFSGSLRLNLDPFNSKSDDDLWTALEQCYLKQFVVALPGQLDYTVSEGGGNMSVGQRQLICLARALLRKSKILVLDEATAAVDLETESLLQKTILEAFADCTMITIAHRLNTILNSDRIIVLKQGRIIEFDKPSILLEDTKSVFYGMAKDAKII